MAKRTVESNISLVILEHVRLPDSAYPSTDTEIPQIHLPYHTTVTTVASATLVGKFERLLLWLADIFSDVLKRHYASCREASKQSKIETSGSAEVQKRDYLVETPAKGNSTASFAPTPPTALLADQPWSTPTSHHAFCLESSFHDSFILSMEPTISFNFLNRFTSGLELRKAFAALDKVADEQLLLPDCTAASRCLCTTLPTIVCQPCRFCTFVGRYSLEQTANQIINDLSSGGSPDGRLIALKAFFSASHLRKGLRLYWSDWHPNLPIIHPCRSPFESAPAPLVAAMAVIGICHSPDPQERADAKLYYDMLERYVFAHLASFRGRQIAGRTLRDLVQALQAAYLVLIYQSWDGERAARLNVRRTRFAQMVEVIHTIGVSRAVHPDYRRIDFADFDFQAYVETEELVRSARKSGVDCILTLRQVTDLVFSG